MRRIPKPRHSIINLLFKIFLLLTGILVIYRLLVEGNKMMKMDIKETYRRAHNTDWKLQNPYSYSRSTNECVGMHLLPNSIKSLDWCSELDEVTGKDKNGTKVTRHACFRKMTSPSAECFDEAARDCSFAILRKNWHKLGDILRAWPGAERKKLFNEGLARAKKRLEDEPGLLEELKEWSNNFRQKLPAAVRKYWAKEAVRTEERNAFFKPGNEAIDETLEISELLCDLEEEPHQLVPGKRNL